MFGRLTLLDMSVTYPIGMDALHLIHPLLPLYMYTCFEFGL